MTLVPALAELHAARKLRLARMAGAVTPPPRPLSFEAPTVLTAAYVEAEPVFVSTTIKHQVVVLHATGMESWRIAKRLQTTKNVVAGVIYRAKKETPKLLLCDACMILAGLGFDTVEIGHLVDEPEHVVYNLIFRGRERARAAG